MPAPTLPTFVSCLTLSFLCINKSLFRSPFLMASAQSVIAPPESHLLSGNPWGATFEETVAFGFALERVELLPGLTWRVSARVSCPGNSFTDKPGHVAVLFITPAWATTPTESGQVRTFLLSPNAWIPINATASILQLATSTVGTKQLLHGYFDSDTIPRNSTSSGLEQMLNTSATITTHPTIPDVDLIHIDIPHDMFTILSPTPASTDSETSRILTIGVAFLNVVNGNSNAHDHIYSGLVRVSDPETVPLSRSFTAVTAQRFNFIETTNVQVIETYSGNAEGGIQSGLTETGWGYTAVVTFRLEDGVTTPRLDPTQSVFVIAPSISYTDESMWNAVSCPDMQQAVIPAGCATDLIRVNSSFCQIETVWRDPLTETGVIAYRFRVKLSQSNTAPSPTDQLFLRLRLHALDTNAVGTKTHPEMHTFMNVQTPLLATTIRCGAIVVRRPDSKDIVRLLLYTGSDLTPLQEGTPDVPLVPSATMYPHMAMTAPNLRARGILDSIITIALIGEDASFPPVSTQQVSMVDLISIHVRDESLHNTLNNLVRTGAAYSVRFSDKHITTSHVFQNACATLPDYCAVRELMRAGTLLLPAHTHVATSLMEDTSWFTRLFNDETTSPLVAQTFALNAYTSFQPNNRYRRLLWVASTYEWLDIPQAGLKDHTILLASFIVK